MPDSKNKELIDDIEKNYENSKETLKKLVAIPGVAWDSYNPKDQEKMAKVTAKLLTEAGLKNVEILSVKDGDVQGKPAVLGSLPAADGYPTVLLYAHHDVQPEGDPKLWNTPPFEAVEKNGRMYGRGAADDKAGIMVHLNAIRAMVNTYGDNLKLGIKVFIEGEEEAGSPTFRKFLDTYKDQLEADAIIVADSGNWETGTPALTTTLRGVHSAVMELEVLDHAVHSGMYSGPAIDALSIMCKIIASFHDEKGNVAIEGLVSYDDSEIDMKEETFRQDSSVLPDVELAGEGSITSRIWTKPSMTLIGFDAPAVDVASNTLIPKARACYSLRLAPGQDPQEAFELVQKHVKKHAPLGIDVKFSHTEFGKPFKTDLTQKFATAMKESLDEAWGKQSVETGVGGSIPFTADLKELYPEAEILITGVEDPDSRAHSPNESLELDDWKKAMIAETLFLAKCQDNQ
ncbi:MAG: dipeptidase [Micrococcaceae bacterium]